MAARVFFRKRFLSGNLAGLEILDSYTVDPDQAEAEVAVVEGLAGQELRPCAGSGTFTYVAGSAYAITEGCTP